MREKNTTNEPKYKTIVTKLDLLNQGNNGMHPFLCGCILSNRIDELGITGIQRQGFYNNEKNAVKGRVDEHQHIEGEHIFLLNGKYDGETNKKHLYIDSDTLHGCSDKEKMYYGNWISIKTTAGVDKINIKFASKGKQTLEKYNNLSLLITHNDSEARIFSLSGISEDEKKNIFDKLPYDSNRIFIESKIPES